MRTLVIILLCALAAACTVRQLERDRPQDVPWTPLRIEDPVGRMTGVKIARLGADPAACRAWLEAAGVRATAVDDRRTDQNCGWTGAVRLSPPTVAAPPTTVTCPVAVGMAIWRRQVVDPAATRTLGTRVKAPTHLGSYNCRRINGRDSGSFSEHATANAIDISGFELSNGSRVTVASDWTRSTRKSDFLREVRDGACRIFGTTLSPEYNAAHADHLHLDMGRWGGFGFCR